MAGINTYMIVMPFTKEYMRYVSKEYKEIITSALSKIPYEVHFIDFNDLNMFEDDEFADPEHLNEKGAHKFSEILNGILI